MQWYHEIIDKQGLKKNQEFQKKLKTALDDYRLSMAHMIDEDEPLLA